MPNIVWARTPFVGPRPWVFMAGPTTREPERIPSWRPNAVEHFDELGFTGTLLIPEDGPDRPPFDEELHSEKQVFWEWDSIDAADCVMFWVPRDPDGMLALTTNTEFGYMVASGKVVLGFPDDAYRCNYLRMLARRHGISCRTSLFTTCAAAITLGTFQANARPHYDW